MIKIYKLSFLLSLILISCTDSNIIGLEVQPEDEDILFNNIIIQNIDFSNISEDSVRTDETTRLLLGEMNDDLFGYSSASFTTQFYLQDENIDLGTNPEVISVNLTYNYSDYYGDLTNFSLVQVYENQESLDKQQEYYSNEGSLISKDSLVHINSYETSLDLDNPLFTLDLEKEFGKKILDLGNSQLQNNEIFQQYFKGISVLAYADNTILMLNPEGTNSKFRIYYKNDENQNDTLLLEFLLGNDAARVNVFNEKSNPVIINNTNNIYIQSMSGYKSKIIINNLDSIKDILANKTINKATINFGLSSESVNSFYDAHEKLFLRRVDKSGNLVDLADYTLEGESFFKGNLDESSYQFNITRYIHSLLTNNMYTNELHLLDKDANIKANRTVLEKNISLIIYYSQL